MKNLANPSAYFYLFFCMLLCSSNLFAGNTKLHVTTDKERYNAAEMIQFQVVLLNPSAKINNTLFVELLDCNGNRLAKQMLPFNLNVSSGHVSLPETGKAEFYLLYCYVNNFAGQECSSIKKLFVKNNNTTQQKLTGGKINVSSFFEGGTLVAESPNNILIQCTDEKLNPVVTKGKITNGKTNIYAVFETNELGFAKVNFNPEDKVQYFIEVKDINNNRGIGSMPIAASSGITLNTTVTQSSIVYNLVSYTSPTDNIPDYRIEAVCGDTIVYDAVISFQNGLSAVKEELKRENLPTGFITFRLTDKSKKVYAQRVVYNDGAIAKNNFISVIDTVNKREAKIVLPDMVSGKAYIQIKTADSAFAEKKEPEFLQANAQISINDQLIAASAEPAGFSAMNTQANRYLSLSGVLLNSEKKPLKNKNVNLILLHKNFKKQYLVTKTNREGRLQVDNLIFFDTVTVYYQLADKSDEKNDVYLDLTVTPSKEYAGTPLPALNQFCNPDQQKAGSNNAAESTDEKVLGEVVVSSEKPKTDSEKFTENYVSGQMKRTEGIRNEVDFIKNPEAGESRLIWNYLQSTVPNIRIVISPQGTPLIYGTFGCTVTVYLNDMELGNNESLSFLNNLTIKDIGQVKYYSVGFKPKIIGGNPLTDLKACDGGDLLIYTKQGFTPSEEKTKGLPKTTVAGYTLEKRADATALLNNGSNLFWKPGMTMENGQRIYVGIPAGDAKKDVEIIIEGTNVFFAPYRFTQKLAFK